MLIHPSLERLSALRLVGMRQAFEEQLQLPEINTLSFEERFGLLIDREWTLRENRRLTARLKKATLRHRAATLEDVDYRHPRGLDKSLLTRLATSQWVRDHHNVLIVGPTGVGKSWLACALIQKACRDGLTARYLHLTKLLRELTLGQGDGRYPKLMKELAHTDLIALDDFGLEPLQDQQQQILLELMEDRYALRSTLMTSQYPIEHWHERIGNPTLADAILDRIVHNAYKLNLQGESLRKPKRPLTTTEDQS